MQAALARGRSALFPFALAVLAALPAGCRPPAADDYADRTGRAAPASARGPAVPQPSPDTSAAVWAPGQRGGRLLYGTPGQPPLMAIECRQDGAGPTLAYTRFAPADAGAKAVLALIGNGHVERLFVDAADAGAGPVWMGAVSAADPRLEVLTGGRPVEATIPGAGSMMLKPSPLLGELVRACRASAPPPPQPQPQPQPTPTPTPAPPATPG